MKFFLIRTALVYVLWACVAVCPVLAQYNYAEALQKALYFYEVQRSGRMPANNRVDWRGNAHLKDGADAKVDLSGGWYDAGDTPKWNVTMAFAGTTLAWSAVQYKQGYTRSAQMPYLLGNLRWVCDYFLKCFKPGNPSDPATYKIFIEVGDANKEHGTWAANEVMHVLIPYRPSYYVDKDAPGTSVVAAMAATLASSAIVFRENGQAAYADKLIPVAEKLYAFARKYQGNGKMKNAKGEIVNQTEFYDGQSFYDQLCWAALWLSKAIQPGNAATGKPYLAQAEEYAKKFGADVPTADYWYSGHNVASFILLTQLVPSNSFYTKQVEGALHNITTKPKSPGGLAKLGNEWGTLRHVNSQAWLCFAYADRLPDGPQKEKYLSWAKSQLDYALGSNPQNRSYVLGFRPAGKSVVNTPHHRTAHGPWAGWEHLTAGKPEFRLPARHIAYGGLVGGPDWNDNYKAETSDAARNELALDFNAGFTANAARMTAKVGGTPVLNFPPKSNREDEYFVEAVVDGTKDDCIDIKAIINNRSAWPARVRHNLSFRYYFQPEPGTTVTASILSSDNASISAPVKASNKLSYVTVIFKNTAIYPGGLDKDHDWKPLYKREVVFRLKSSGAWNNQNDWSFKGLAAEGQSPVKVANIPVLDTTQKLYGKEPGTPAKPAK